MIRGGGNGRAELRLGGGEALLAVVVLEGVQVEVLLIFFVGISYSKTCGFHWI